MTRKMVWLILGNIAALVLVLAGIGAIASYRYVRTETDRYQTGQRLNAETQQRIEGVKVIEQMQRDGKSDAEIEAYAAKNVPGWGSGQ